MTWQTFANYFVYIYIFIASNFLPRHHPSKINFLELVSHKFTIMYFVISYYKVEMSKLRKVDFDGEIESASIAMVKASREISAEQRVFNNPYLLAEIARQHPDAHEKLANLSGAYRRTFGGDMGRGFRSELRDIHTVKTTTERNGRVTEAWTYRGIPYRPNGEPAVVSTAAGGDDIVTEYYEYPQENPYRSDRIIKSKNVHSRYFYRQDGSTERVEHSDGMVDRFDETGTMISSTTDTEERRYNADGRITSIYHFDTEEVEYFDNDEQDL